MKSRRLIPYLIALLLLAWVLGSLARSGTTGGSLLSNSEWLVYTVELFPLLALGLMVALGVYLIINWRLLSDALGFGMSGRRRAGKRKNRTVQIVVYVAIWGVAIGVLMTRCGTILSAKCNTANTVQSAATVVQNSVSPDPLPVLGPAVALGNLVGSDLFIIAFFGLAIMSGVIMVKAYTVSWKNRGDGQPETGRVVEKGQEAVQDAIRILDGEESKDPRAGIIACYQRMIKAAMLLGAPVGPDRTARELEKGLREMFMLKGSGITRLTGLFEVARYSLHPMSEDDSQSARECLFEIRQELDETNVSSGNPTGTASVQV